SPPARAARTSGTSGGRTRSGCSRRSARGRFRTRSAPCPESLDDATIPPLEIGVPRRLVPHHHDIAHDRQGVPTPRWVRALLICLLGVSRGGVTEGSERWEPIGTGRASGEDDVLVAHLPGQIWL